MDGGRKSCHCCATAVRLALARGWPRVGRYEHVRHWSSLWLGMGLVHSGLAVVAEGADRCCDARWGSVVHLGSPAGEPMGLRGTQVRKEVRRMVKPVIGTGIKLGKPRVEVDHSRPINKNAERLDGTVRKGESVVESISAVFSV